MTVCAGLIGAMLGIVAVLVGTALDIQGFCPSTGYWGTHFLNSMLYAMPGQNTAIGIVCGFWGLYGAAIGVVASLLVGRRRGGGKCRP